MKIDFEQEVEETYKKRKPKKARDWHLANQGNNSRINKWQRNCELLFLNTIELTPAKRLELENCYYFAETNKVDVYAQLEELTYDLEEDAYQAQLREEAESVIEREGHLLKEAINYGLTFRQKQVLELYLAGYKQKEIGVLLGITGHAISGMFYGSTNKQGKRIGGIIQALKTEIERIKVARNIFKLKAEGLTTREIAKKLGCGLNTIWKYSNRYKELENEKTSHER